MTTHKNDDHSLIGELVIPDKRYVENPEGTYAIVTEVHERLGYKLWFQHSENERWNNHHFATCNFKVIVNNMKTFQIGSLVCYINDETSLYIISKISFLESRYGEVYDLIPVSHNMSRTCSGRKSLILISEPPNE